MHPDLLFETADRKPINLELHGYWMDDFAVRNLLYFAFILRDHKRAPEQIVLWIGKHRPGVPDGLSLAPKLVYNYRVIDVRTLDAEPLLASGGTDEAVFAGSSTFLWQGSGMHCFSFWYCLDCGA